MEYEKNNAIKNIPNQLLTFIIGGEEFGVDILSVVEIRGWEEPTAIPASPAHVKGVINLRGVIIPIIDLRQKFRMTDFNYSSTTVIVVLQMATPEGKRINGVVVDAISDVYNINLNNFSDTPDMGNIHGKEFIAGLINFQVEDETKMVILLDVEQLMKKSETVLDKSELTPETQGE